jgi:hypothetical protein
MNLEALVRRSTVSIFALLALAACSGTSPTAQPLVDPGVVTVALSPTVAQVGPSEALPFVATVSGTSNPAVRWHVVESGGGTIDSNGLYQSPAQPGTFHVAATSVADGSKTATAAVTVTSSPAAVVAVSISPQSRSVGTGSSVQFAASVSGTSDTRVTWTVSEGSAGGSVDSNGLYQAPAQAGAFHVVATSVADATRSATATVTVTSSVPTTDLAAQLAVLARHAILFEHASVGENIVDGVGGLLQGVSGPKPTIINMNASIGGLKPDLMQAGVWAESMKLALLNGSPMQKITTFRDDLAGGSGAKVDIAFMKFCFVDFDGSTDPAALFSAYQSMITSAKAQYPNVHFVHFTAPLETISNGAYNVVREAFSARVRAAYGADVFDLALLESTCPGGRRELSGGVPALCAEYTGDSGHLNSNGQAWVVPELVKFLANLP